jgi:hypothetical protein
MTDLGLGATPSGSSGAGWYGPPPVASEMLLRSETSPGSDHWAARGREEHRRSCSLRGAGHALLLQGHDQGVAVRFARRWRCRVVPTAGSAATEILLSVIADLPEAVVDCNFSPSWADRFVSPNVAVVEVFCRVPPEIATRRFAERARHEGHRHDDRWSVQDCCASADGEGSTTWTSQLKRFSVSSRRWTWGALVGSMATANSLRTRQSAKPMT